jgi:hypothetical protein
LSVALRNHVRKKLVNLRHLPTVPLNLILRIVAPIFKQTAGFEHLCVLFDVHGRLSIPEVMHLIFKISTFIRKDLVRIFFASGAALQFGQVATIRQTGLNLSMLVLKELKLGSHRFNQQSPGLIKQLVFFKLSSYVTLVFFVVSCNFRFALLEDFNLKASLSWPLLTQVFI